jgi:hypothetical protein
VDIGVGYLGGSKWKVKGRTWGHLWGSGGGNNLQILSRYLVPWFCPVAGKELEVEWLASTYDEMWHAVDQEEKPPCAPDELAPGEYLRDLNSCGEHPRGAQPKLERKLHVL